MTLGILTRLRSLLGRQATQIVPLNQYSTGTLIRGSDIDVHPINTKRDAADNYAGWIFAASTFIAEEMRSLDWVLYRRTSIRRDEWDRDDRHAFNQVMSRPNPSESWGDLLERSVVSFNVAGEYFWLILKDGNRPVGFQLILPHWVNEPIFERSGVHVGWRITVPGLAPKDYAREDVIRVYRPHPLSPWLAASAVEAAAVSHYFDQYLRAYGMTVFRNDAGVPAGLLSSDQVLTTAQADVVREAWKQRYSRAREVAVLGQNTKYQAISVPLADLKFLEAGQFTQKQILSLYRVPASLLGEDSSGVNRATIEGHLYSLQRHSLRPLAARVEDAVNNRVAPIFIGPTSRAYSWEFIDVVTKDRTAIREEAKEGLLVGGMTINEYRQALDRDPVADGDVYLIPNTHQVSTTLAPREPDGEDSGEDEAEDLEALTATVLQAAAKRRAAAEEESARLLKVQHVERRLRGLIASWWRDRGEGDVNPTGLDEYDLTPADLPMRGEAESPHEWIERLKGFECKRLADLSVTRSPPPARTAGNH